MIEQLKCSKKLALLAAMLTCSVVLPAQAKPKIHTLIPGVSAGSV